MKTKKNYKVSVRKRENPNVMSRTVIHSHVFEDYKRALLSFRDLIADYDLNYSKHESDTNGERVCLRIYDETKKILILLEEI